MGIDVWEVIEAAATKPFGFQVFYPGPGLGGHCIPIDPFYLSWIARKHGLPTRFIELAGQINTQMPNYVVDRVTATLNEVKKPVIATNHSAYDYDFIVKHSKLVIDTRNATKKVMEGRERIRKA
jgi:UDP-N-acetyl-D-mannosaminuronate dehydrogenase